MPFEGRTGTAHIAVALAADRMHRDAIREALTENGIQSSLHYPPVHLFRHYRDAYGCAPGDCPMAEALADRAVTLPLYSTMTPEQVDEVSECVAAVPAPAGAAQARR